MAIQGVRHGLRTRGGFNVEIQLVGEWIRVERILNHLNVDMAIAGAGAQRKFAEEYRDRVQYHIRTGGIEFGFEPHSKEYARYKARYGGGSSLLHWSGSMEKAVKVLPLGGDRIGVGIEKGVKREKYHPKDSGILEIHQYANILEKGSPGKGIPARPVFAETFKKDMKGLMGLKNYMTLHIAAELKAKGIPITKI